MDEESATLNAEDSEKRRHGEGGEVLDRIDDKIGGVETDSSDPVHPVKGTPRLPSSNNSVFSDSNSTPGYLLTRVGTNEVFSFGPPDGAIVCADGRAFGAANDWVYLVFTNWAFSFGADKG